MEFAQVSNYDPTGREVWWDLPLEPVEFAPGEFGPQPKLLVLHAGRSNKGYTNALGKAQMKLLKKVAVLNGASTSESLDADIKKDRELFTDHVVVGWQGVYNAQLEKVEFSREMCRQFLFALPDWIMSSLKTFADNPRNFIVENNDPTPEEVAAQAGN